MGTEAGTKWELKVGTGNSSGGNNPHVKVGTVPAEFPPLFPPLTVGRKGRYGEVGTRNRIQVCESPHTPLSARAPEGAPRGQRERTRAIVFPVPTSNRYSAGNAAERGGGNSHLTEHSLFSVSGFPAPWARPGRRGVPGAKSAGISPRGPNVRVYGKYGGARHGRAGQSAARRTMARTEFAGSPQNPALT